MKAVLTPFGPSVLVDKPKKYVPDFQEPFNAIKLGKENGEDFLNDFIAEVESVMGYMLARTDDRESTAQKFQKFINMSVALREAWARQCEASMEGERDARD